MQQIQQEVRQFVIENFVFDNDGHNISDDDSFFDTGLLDSMGVLTLMEFVREKFGISVEDGELLPENWDSVNRVTAFVRAKLSIAATAQSDTTQIVQSLS